MTFIIFGVTLIGIIIAATSLGLVAKHEGGEAKYEKLFDTGIAVIVLSFVLMLIFFAGTDVGY
jgi:hypothetical protein